MNDKIEQLKIEIERIKSKYFNQSTEIKSDNPFLSIANKMRETKDFSDNGVKELSIYLDELVKNENDKNIINQLSKTLEDEIFKIVDDTYS